MFVAAPPTPTPTPLQGAAGDALGSCCNPCISNSYQLLSLMAMPALHCTTLHFSGTIIVHDTTLQHIPDDYAVH